MNIWLILIAFKSHKNYKYKFFFKASQDLVPRKKARYTNTYNLFMRQSIGQLGPILFN